MLDMMSYNPGPTREGATTEVYSELRYDYPSIYPPYLKSVVKKVVYSYEEGGLGSEAGWLVGYKKDVLDKVHGILLQHPVPSQIDERLCFDAISINKDVDGVTCLGFGNMSVSYTHLTLPTKRIV